MRATTLILLFLLAALRPSSCQNVSSIQPAFSVQVLPEESRLNTFTFLVCNPEPNSQLTQSDYVSRWTIPSGETFTYLAPISPGFERYRILQGPSVGQNVQREAIFLFMEMLSYQDAGNYTCEVRSSASAQSPWFSASVELQLEVNLQATVSNVTAHSGDTEVELACEMTLFVRPDQDLQWFRGSEMIVSGTDRYIVSYHNGLTEAAQNGGNVTIPGRVSMLTISNPQLSDSGAYTCRILGTEQSADVQLSVEVAFPATPTPPVTTTATPATPMGPGATLSTEIIAVIVVVGLVLTTTIIIATVIIAIIVNRKKGFNTTTNMAYGVNLHHLETTAHSNAQTTSTDYYVNEGLGPNQPTSGEYYSYPFSGPHAVNLNNVT